MYSYVILALLNGIWAEERLTLLLDFVKKAIVTALKVVMGMITGFSMVQAVILPVVDKLKISAFRKAVSAIPGVGGVAEGITELVIGSAVLIKNSLGVLMLVLLLAACAMPLVRILTVQGTWERTVYRLSCASFCPCPSPGSSATRGSQAVRTAWGRDASFSCAASLPRRPFS